MKTKLLAILAAVLALSGSSIPAANIAFVSFHPADGTPSANALAAGFTNAPDMGYTALLAANGHTVTRFVSQDNLDIALLPDGITPLLSALITNDLIIVSRSVPSGHYQQDIETTTWNGITNPVIILGGYITRGGTGANTRLGLTTGETMTDVNVNQVRLRVNTNVLTHPIFNGVALDSTNLMVNPYAVRVTFTNATTGVTTNQLGISINNNAIIAGGTVLAVVGTAGSAGLNGMVIGEIPAGATASQPAPRADVLGGKRLIFLTGSRESGITGEGSGIYDLLTDGNKLLLNAVTYLTTSIPPKCTLPLVGATNLVAGDIWTFNAGVIGHPLTFQWYKDGQPLATGTSPALVFASLNPATDAGEYQLIVTNSLGSATSTVARLEFKVFAPASITNSLISYWPLDGILGTKSIDLVSSYDMSLVNMSAADLVAGKYGNAFQFNGTNSLLVRANNAGDALPIYQHPEFSVSLWVNAPVPSAAIRDRRVYSESAAVNGNPLFNIGTDNRNPPVDGSVDIYIRRDDGSVALDHIHSTAIAYDGGNWHNIVYVQRDIGGGRMKAQLWVDGVLDPLEIAPVRPLSATITSFGGIRRSSDAAWFNGIIDEVAVWNRALSAEEVAILQVTTITNPPSRVQPLAINSFKADLPAVVSGGSTTLRWDVSKDASQVLISPLGDLTAQTSVGIGSRSITQSVSTTYVLTVNRGVSDRLSATTSVAVVNGVAPGWTLLDNFDQAALGNLFTSGYWNDTSGNGGQVVSVNGNRAARTTSAGISFLNLRALSIQETQTCTLFFRIIAGENNAAGVTNMVGLTDKSQRGYDDSRQNIGPVVYATPFINADYFVETNGWYLGARNGYDPVGDNASPLIDYNGPISAPVQQPALEASVVYNVWVDITNAPLADNASDIFTVHVQRDGGAPRTVLFQDFVSDRDPLFVDPVLGGILPTLDKLVLMGNSATLSAVFDDFYLSKGAYNATVPRPYGFTGTVSATMGIRWSGTQLEIQWTAGVLQHAPAVTGPWEDVPGSPTSPYLVAPTGDGKYYRVR